MNESLSESHTPERLGNASVISADTDSTAKITKFTDFEFIGSIG